MTIPRILIAGLQGGGGKTLVSLGLTAAWRRRGHIVAPFKKGPDYIDAAWLTMAAGMPCRNLDLFFMSNETIVRSYLDTVPGAGFDVAVIEGNRGLYDGVDAKGSYSTAELAKLLKVPVVIAVDCTKTTRTVAALVLGCQKLDPAVNIGGVVLNQTHGSRHDSVLREAVEEICGLPILGAIPRLHKELLPERHLGLVPPQETDELPQAVQRVAEVAEQHLELDALWELASEAPSIEAGDVGRGIDTELKPRTVKIGVFRDTAFQFYYPENLEALEREGAQLIEVSPLREAELPAVDALYIGGGFPEMLAPALAENERFHKSLRDAVEMGLPVYAECGGAVFLGQKLIVNDKHYDMAGVLPVTFDFHKKPQGHGYAILEASGANPLYEGG